jgi:hypothetical protein
MDAGQTTGGLEWPPFFAADADVVLHAGKRSSTV